MQIRAAGKQKTVEGLGELPAVFPGSLQRQDDGNGSGSGNRGGIGQAEKLFTAVGIVGGRQPDQGFFHRNLRKNRIGLL